MYVVIHKYSIIHGFLPAAQRHGHGLGWNVLLLVLVVLLGHLAFGFIFQNCQLLKSSQNFENDSNFQKFSYFQKSFKNKKNCSEFPLPLKP